METTSTQAGGVAEPVVLINSFEVEKGKEEEFVAHWRRCAEHLKQQDGHISHRMHQSLDPGARLKFVNVAVWQSYRHSQMALAAPAFLQIAEGIPGKLSPGVYRVIAEDPLKHNWSSSLNIVHT